MNWKSKKKKCPFERGVLDPKAIHYSNVKFLKKFITDGVSKIMPSRLTGVSRPFQKKLTQQIKYARYLGLIRFSDTVHVIIR